MLLAVGGCRGEAPGDGPADGQPPEVLPAGLVAQGYAGSRVCGECHAELVAGYAATGHARSAWDGSAARTLLPADSLPAQLAHAASGFSYQAALTDGRLVVQERYRLPDGSTLNTGSAQAAVILGSGRLTFSSLGARPLTLPDGPAVELFQLPLTRYRTAGLWGMSPGYDRPDQQRFGRPVGERCLFCHDGPQQPVPGEPAAFVPPLVHGIGCERCHGPAAAHVAFQRRTPGGAALGRGAAGSGEADPLLRLADLTPALRQDVCLSCHLEGEARVPRRGRASLYDWRPGQPLSSLLYVFGDDQPSPRLFSHSSQGERFLLSRCVTASAGRLTCRDCHPPHQPSPKDPGSYDRVCQRCHEPARCSRPLRTPAEHRTPKDPCTDCHMAWDGTSDIPHVTTIDHWIRRPAAEPPAPLAADPATARLRGRPLAELTLAARLAPELGRDTPGERGAALATAYLELGRSAAPPELTERARAALAPALATEPGQAGHWRLLARIEAQAGRRVEQCRALGQAAALDRDDAATWEELGICRGEASNARGARQALEQAHRVAPRRAAPLERLGYLAARSGQSERAEAWYRQAIAAEPGSPTPRHQLAALKLRQGDLATAEAQWREAVRLEPRSAAAVEGLREALARQGKRDEARLWARQAVRLLPGDAEAERRRRELEGP